MSKKDIAASSRRNFLKTSGASASVLLAGAAGAGSLLVGQSALAQSGQGYEEIQPPQQTVAAEGKVEVLEYFWFGCPHCYAFEPTINEWAANKPDYVEFVREAPPLNPNWRPH